MKNKDQDEINREAQALTEAAAPSELDIADTGVAVQPASR